MYLFSRTGHAKPDHLVDALTFAVVVSDKVTSITGQPVTAFTGVFPNLPHSVTGITK